MKAPQKSTDEKNGDLFPGAEVDRAPRGKRWRECDEVTEAWLLEAAKFIEHKTTYARINLRAEALKFANFWIAKGGKGGLKVNWRRTWMNWALTAAQYAGHREREGQLSGDGYHENDDDYGIGYRP